MTEKQIYQIMKDLKWNKNQYEYHVKEHFKTGKVNLWGIAQDYNHIIDGMMKVLDTIMTEDEVDKIVEWLESDEEPTLMNARRWWEAHQ